MNLLEMVQDILSDMSSDNVNSIYDTEESTQVAQIIRTTYEEMMGRRDWPHLKQLMALESFSDPMFPTYLLLPENARRLEWVNYNKRTVDKPEINFQRLKWLEPRDFIQWSNSRQNSNPATMLIMSINGVSYKIDSSIPPTYFTSFTDRIIVLDSFVSDLESTVQGSQTQCEIYMYPTWNPIDTFVPNIPIHLFPALLAEAKSTCFLVLKQMENAKAEQISRRQQNALSLRGWRVHGGIRYPNYGRRV